MSILGLAPPVGLDVPDPDIDALVFFEMRRLEHLVGLPDSRNISKENLQFAPLLLQLFFLYAGKQRIGVRALIRTGIRAGWHRSGSHSKEDKQHIDDLYSDERGNKPADTVDQDVVP